MILTVKMEKDGTRTVFRGTEPLGIVGYASK